MYTWLDVSAKEEEYRDLLRQAEKERLIRSVRPQQRFLRLLGYICGQLTTLPKGQFFDAVTPIKLHKVVK